MREITCVLLTRQERDALVRCKPFIGLGGHSDEETAEFERRWNGLLQRHEVLTYEAVERGQIVARRAMKTALVEAKPEHWESSVTILSDQGLRMIEVITESRVQIIVDLTAALLVLDAAVQVATPRLFGDDLEEDGEDFS